MHLRLVALALGSACLLAGCETPFKKSDKAREDAKKDASKDPSFQGFIGRLQTAVRTKDFEVLGSLMAPDFGYRWETPPAGESVFTYWNEQNVWPHVTEVLRAKFAPNGEFMVAPPEFAANPDTYQGWRAGMRIIGGSWRFAYFVPAPTAGEQAAQ